MKRSGLKFYLSRGFTLIEILIVVSIIGTLATLVVVSVNNANAKSKATKRKVDAENLAGALAMYKNDNKEYPHDLYNNHPAGYPCTESISDKNCKHSATDPDTLLFTVTSRDCAHSYSVGQWAFLSDFLKSYMPTFPPIDTVSPYHIRYCNGKWNQFASAPGGINNPGHFQLRAQLEAPVGNGDTADVWEKYYYAAGNIYFNPIWTSKEVYYIQQ